MDTMNDFRKRRSFQQKACEDITGATKHWFVSDDDARTDGEYAYIDLVLVSYATSWTNALRRGMLPLVYKKVNDVKWIFYKNPEEGHYDYWYTKVQMTSGEIILFRVYDDRDDKGRRQ